MNRVYTPRSYYCLDTIYHDRVKVECQRPKGHTGDHWARLGLVTMGWGGKSLERCSRTAERGGVTSQCVLNPDHSGECRFS